MANYVNLLDIVYPVGSVYITFNSVNPSNSVGGTWEKIEDKFLQSSVPDERCLSCHLLLADLPLKSNCIYTMQRIGGHWSH